MDTSLLVAAGASFVAGLLGYIIARLWIKPIVHYTATKRKLDRELNRYLAMIDEPDGTKDIQDAQERKAAHLKTARKCAMDMVSCYDADIPYWYRLLLDSRKESPGKASGLLTNISRIRDPEMVKQRIGSARKAMGLK